MFSLHMKVKCTAVSLGCAALLLTGCSSGDAPGGAGPGDGGEETTASPTESPDSEPSATDVDVTSDADEEADEAAQGSGEVEYVDPSGSDDYCGVLADLDEFSKQASGQTDDASIDQLGERLDLLVATGERLVELSPTEDAKDDWSEYTEAYSDVRDFYVSSGQQISNDDFITELAKSVEVTNRVYESRRESVKDECGVDLDQFIVG